MSQPTTLHTPLHQINTLVAGITQVNPILFDGIQSAINFSIYEGEPLPEKSNLAESVKRLIALYECEGKQLGFAHCDLQTFSPLWHRVCILEAMEKLSGHPQSLLLVTGLKESFHLNERWTPSSKKAYAQAIHFVETLASNYPLGKTELHILFF